MLGDPKECREHASDKYWQLASETKNPELRQSLADLAQTWARLATDIDATRRYEKWAAEAPKSNTG